MPLPVYIWVHVEGFLCFSSLGWRSGNEAKEKVRVSVVWVCVCVHAYKHACVQAFVCVNIHAVCVCFGEEGTKARRLK